jgi:hypothetical protein
VKNPIHAFTKWFLSFFFFSSILFTSPSPPHDTVTTCEVRALYCCSVCYKRLWYCWRLSVFLVSDYFDSSSVPMYFLSANSYFNPINCENKREPRLVENLYHQFTRVDLVDTRRWASLSEYLVVVPKKCDCKLKIVAYTSKFNLLCLDDHPLKPAVLSKGLLRHLRYSANYNETDSLRKL